MTNVVFGSQNAGDDRFLHFYTADWETETAFFWDTTYNTPAGQDRSNLLLPRQATCYHLWEVVIDSINAPDDKERAGRFGTGKRLGYGVRGTISPAGERLIRTAHAAYNAWQNDDDEAVRALIMSMTGCVDWFTTEVARQYAAFITSEYAKRERTAVSR